MSLYFQNPGEINILGATVAGLSVKEGDSPIGFFGTGLKYSIACILRWNGQIIICSGVDSYNFAVSTLAFRGKEFQQITMSLNGGEARPLGFTTDYGKNWKPWHVFRELYANALDEGGTVTQQASNQTTSGQTTIIITCPDVEAEFFERNKIILPADQIYDFSSANGHICNRANEYFYYRGVRVWQKQTALTYNIIAKLDLTEDRTLNGSWSATHRAAELIQLCDDPTVIRVALEADENYLEHDMKFYTSDQTSPAFIEVAESLFKQNPRRHDRLKEILRQHKPESVSYTQVPLNSIQMQMFERAKQLVARMDMSAVRYTDIAVVELGKDTLGTCENGKIYLSPLLFKQGTKQLVSTLYEEMLHHTTGMVDNTYEMQTYLFNKIVDLYEEHVFQAPC